MERTIKQKIVVISGASSGIGAAAAKAFGQEGARVVLLARTESALKELAEKIGNAHYYPVDLGEFSSVREVCEKIKKEVGIPDVLINNAGMGRWLSIEETAWGEMEKMTAVPYFAAFNLTKGFITEMKQKGSGQIINVTSPAAFSAWPGSTAYITARWAMRGFSKALRAELHATDIGVCLLTPGKVSSEYFQNNPGSEERIPKLDKYYPTMTPEQVAETMVKIVKQKKGDVAIPLLMDLTIRFQQLFPSLVDLLLIKTGWKQK